MFWYRVFECCSGDANTEGFQYPDQLALTKLLSSSDLNKNSCFSRLKSDPAAKQGLDFLYLRLRYCLSD